MNNYNPQPGGSNLLASDWGNTNARFVAQDIRHVADKVQFALQMLRSVVDGSDVIEKEIIDASNATTPITREGLRAFAYRIDGQQVQINQVISHLEQMMRDINSSTENIQHSRTGW
ncbi:hypothetical protein COK00_11845 [Bacillus cereus]|uniref:hypothetical protein n=1 Tax=Bacillus cereus group TaxID=86661 RepID=UPI000BF4E46B|nr:MULTISPECIES: hypothetical protein [Bacillus cereus group]MCU5076859.1 hypothetical protein [Bacillus cereus]MDA1616407.1 hypothetical protein [Bacillus cereus group sp. TH204-1LC]PFB64303.1 hypothetical protein CN291_16480 [Bacillus cereus]PFP65286.1 hypothetical protein COK00_11845 [Bacillus cereus]PGT10154.1 hypothetical protein COD03_20505 [Bacillus cereus]